MGDLTRFKFRDVGIHYTRFKEAEEWIVIIPTIHRITLHDDRGVRLRRLRLLPSRIPGMQFCSNVSAQAHGDEGRYPDPVTVQNERRGFYEM
jgi:hypothetical protein